MIIDILLFYCEGRGGVEDVTTKISNGLIAKGHRVRIFQSYAPQYEEWGKNLVEFYFFGAGLPWNSSIGDYAANYNKIISKIGKPDVMLVTHEPFCNQLCYLALNEDKKEHTPLISWIHAQVSSYARTPLINYSDIHLAISKGVQQGLSRFINPANIYLVGNPITTKGLNICPRPSTGLSLLFVGRLENGGKRLDVLFNALAKVNGPWNLKIIGNGPSYNMLNQMAKDLNISDNIEWLGWKTKPWEEVKEATLLLMTSDYEGFALVVAEALARGIPVISTKTEGPSEIITNGENGWLIDRGNSNQLTNLLNKIQEKSIMLPTAEKCIESVKKYDETEVTNKIEKVLLDAYNRNQNRKLIDFLLLDESYTKEMQSIILGVYNQLIKRGYRVRFFQPIYSTILGDTDKIVERYIYALDLNIHAPIDQYSIMYKKLINRIGKPDTILLLNRHEFNNTENNTLRDVKRKTPVISLIKLLQKANIFMETNQDLDVIDVVDKMENLFKKIFKRREI